MPAPVEANRSSAVVASGPATSRDFDSRRPRPTHAPSQQERDKCERRRCPCRTTSTSISSNASGPMCSHCVGRYLEPSRSRREAALGGNRAARGRWSVRQRAPAGGGGGGEEEAVGGEGAAAAKSAAGDVVVPPPRMNFEEYRRLSGRLKSRLEGLRRACADEAVRAVRDVTANEERRNELIRSSAGTGTEGAPPSASSRRPSSAAHAHRDFLRSLQGSVLEGAMENAIESGERRVRLLRFHWAYQAFLLHKIDVGTDMEQFIAEERQQQHMEAAGADGAETKETAGAKDRRSRPRGIGKIGGLPLPHAGPELYGVLPPQELQSALRLVASVTALVSRCLGVVLPHPVLLRPPRQQRPSSPSADEHGGDITERGMADAAAALQYGGAGRSRDGRRRRQARAVANMLSELLPSPREEGRNDGDGPRGSGMNDGAGDPISGAGLARNGIYESYSTAVEKAVSADGNLAGARGHPSLSHCYSPPLSSTPPSMEPVPVHHRVKHAVATVLAEDHRVHAAPAPQNRGASASSTSSNNAAPSPPPSPSPPSKAAAAQRYCISVDAMTGGGGGGGGVGGNQDEYAIALQLLQNDVVALCIRSGVPVSKLWPAQAVLLNLHELFLYCRSQISSPLHRGGPSGNGNSNDEISH